MDTGNGGILSDVGDGVANQPTTPTFWNLNSDTVDALAIRRTGVATYTDEIYYSLRGGGTSGLYRARTNGNAAFDSNDARFSRRGTITGMGITGLTTVCSSCRTVAVNCTA